MGNTIKLLPDSIANQIAAGEVVQRPASVVKELMENAIDAGATEIRLIIKGAGKTLIQVIDNGSGMSEMDARMSFERHATSKIESAADLFSIRTMGFRGEALASIAAIAQVEMKTRAEDAELGTRIVISGSKVKTQEPCQCVQGTNFSVRNLFFNIPARRKFLKSDPVEMKHILDEFHHVVLSHEKISFSLHHNENEIYHLPKSNLRQRIVGIHGKRFNEHLVKVEEVTNYVEIEGFVGKPKLGRKTRGEQFLFVNKRFIKSPYLNHAVKAAYEDILPAELHPFYVLYLNIDPNKIDVNVHPTKQQIKFEDERIIYNYVRVAVRHALGKFSVVPTLDFDQEVALNQVPSREDTFKSGGSTVPSAFGGNTDQEKSNIKNWEKVFEGMDGFSIESENQRSLSPDPEVTILAGSSDQKEEFRYKAPYQVHGTYLISQIKSGIIIIDQKAYEEFLRMVRDQEVLTQKTLFPSTIRLTPADAEVMKSVLDPINQMGFEIEDFGQNSFIIHGIPAHMNPEGDPGVVVTQILEQFKNDIDLQSGIEERVARSMARSTAMKRGNHLEVEEMQKIIDGLFASGNPYKSPTGRNCFVTIELSELSQRFTSV